MALDITPELIVSLWCPWDPRVSPDGRLVAWVAGPYGQAEEHDEQSIWVGRVDRSTPARRWTHGTDDSTPRWSPDSSRLAFLSDRKTRGTQSLYGLHTDGGDAVEIVTRKRSIATFAWSPDGRQIAFLAADEPTEDDDRREKDRDDADVWGERWQRSRLWLVDADGGEPTVSWSPDVHLSELAWSADGTRLALLGRDSPLIEHLATTAAFVFRPGDSNGARVCAAPYGGDIGWLGPDTLAYAAPHEAEPQCSGTAWAVAANGGEPWVIGTGVDEPFCTIGICHGLNGTGTVLAVADGLDTRLEWVDPETGARTILDGTADDFAGEVIGMSVGGPAERPVLAVARYGPGLVSEILAGPIGSLQLLSDPASAVRTAAADAKSADDPAQPPIDRVVGAATESEVLLGAVEPLRCRAADDIELDAVVIRPPGGGDGPWPTAVLVHGGPYGRSGLWSHAHPLDWGQLLATNGYAVVMPNYRGGYGHGNAFATSVRGDMGGAEWGDVLSIVDAAVEAGIADPDRLGIGGWSQGGFLTAWAVTNSDRFKAGVMGAGVSDWGMLAATNDLPDFEAALGGDNRWDGPGPHQADAHSPISYASRRTTPLLILHGAEDRRVPATQVIAFRRALAQQDAPLEMVLYPREGHGIKERQHLIDVQRRVLDWFDRYVR